MMVVDAVTQLGVPEAGGKTRSTPISKCRKRRVAGRSGVGRMSGEKSGR